jgi:hypothetical protein
MYSTARRHFDLDRRSNNITSQEGSKRELDLISTDIHGTVQGKSGVVEREK